MRSVLQSTPLTQLLHLSCNTIVIQQLACTGAVPELPSQAVQAIELPSSVLSSLSQIELRCTQFAKQVTESAVFAYAGAADQHIGVWRGNHCFGLQPDLQHETSSHAAGDHQGSSHLVIDIRLSMVVHSVKQLTQHLGRSRCC